MEITFKRRNSSNRREITLSYLHNRANGYYLRAAVLVSTLKTVSGYIRRVKCNENSVEMSKFIQQGRNNVYFSSKLSKWLRSACRYACFEAKNGVHYIRRVNCNENNV